MERLKNQSTSSCTSLPRPSDSSRSGAKSSYSRPSQHTKTMMSNRRQVLDDSSPVGRLGRTWEFHSCHYGNHSVSSRSCDFSRSPQRRERELRPRVEHQEDGPGAQCHESRPTD